MAAAISGSVLTTFQALPTLEAQITYLVSRAVSLQNTYNTANSAAPIARFAIAPNYASKTVTGQFSLAMQDDAAEQTIHENIVAAFP